MSGLLRSVIDYDGGVAQEELVRNFQKLSSSRIEWTRPDDKKICEFTTQYFQTHLEMPQKATLIDYFERQKDVETVERVKDLEKVPAYIRTNYSHLLTTTLEQQNQIKAVQLFKEGMEIASKGLIIDKDKKQGVRDAITHFSEHAHALLVPEGNAKLRGNLRLDGQQVWDEYQTAKVNKDLVWGKFTGLNNIDKVCHGIKKGELWMHAAYAGELKCGRASDTVFDHRTKSRRTLGELFDKGELPVVTALFQEGANFRLVEAQASHLVENGVRDIYRLQLSSGRYVDATTNHKFYTPEGWVELGKLTPGKFVAVPRKLNVSAPRTDFSDSEVRFIGYMLGDGYFGSTSATYLDFAASNPAIILNFEGLLREMGLRHGDAKEFPTAWYRKRSDQKGWRFSAHSQSFCRRLIERLGCWGADSAGKSVPAEFFGLPEDQIALLLGALWSTDGSCHAKDHARSDRESLSRRNDISYASKSRQLCLDVQSLLLRLGIQSSVTTVNTTYKGEPYVFYCVRVVGNDSKRAFTSKIRVVGKEESFARLAERLPVTSGRKIPSAFIPENRKFQEPKGYVRHSNTVKLRPTVTVEEAQKFLRPEDHVLREALEGDLDWESVVSIQYEATEMTYDLSVPKHHSFVVNDIVSHNTTFATNWCYNLVTRYRSNVFYVSLEMTYEHIRRLIYVIHSGHKRFELQGYKPLDYRKVRDGELTPEEEQFYQLVIKDFTENDEYGSFDVWRPDDDVSTDDIKMQAELSHKQNEIGLMVIDHGGLVEPRKKKRNKDYVVELNSVIRDSKKLALNFNHGEAVPILLLFQINRQGKDEADKSEGRYKAKALAYANEAERSADVITTTYLNEEHRKNGTTLFCNLKNRDNPLVEPFEASVDFASRRLFNFDGVAKGGGPGMSMEDNRSGIESMFSFSNV